MRELCKGCNTDCYNYQMGDCTADLNDMSTIIKNSMAVMSQSTYAIPKRIIQQNDMPDIVVGPYHRYGFLIEEPVEPHFIPREVNESKIPENPEHYLNPQGKWVRKVEIILLGTNFFHAVELFKKLYGDVLDVVSTGKY